MHTTKEITAAALALSPYQQLQIVTAILRRQTVVADVQEVIRAAYEACDVEVDYDLRYAPYVQARCIIAHTLCAEGMSTKQVARVLNKTHASVIYMRRRMQDAIDYPGADAELAHRYAIFKKLIYDTERRTTEHPIQLGAEF